MTLVGLEGELEHSRKDPENYKVVLTHDEFKEMLRQGESVYCLCRKSDFVGLESDTKKKLNILIEDKRKVLFAT